MWLYSGILQFRCQLAFIEVPEHHATKLGLVARSPRQRWAVANAFHQFILWGIRRVGGGVPSGDTMIDGQTLGVIVGQEVIIALAAPEVARIFNPARTKLPASDRKSIEEIFGKTKGLKQKQREKALRALQEDGSRGVRAKLARHRKLAAALIKHRRLSGEQVRAVAAGHLTQS
jgi:hypothetical protein